MNLNSGVDFHLSTTEFLEKTFTVVKIEIRSKHCNMLQCPVQAYVF